MRFKNTLSVHMTVFAVVFLTGCFALVGVFAQAPDRATIAFSTNDEAQGGIWLVDIDVRGGQGKGDVHVQNQRVLLAIDGNPIHWVWCGRRTGEELPSIRRLMKILMSMWSTAMDKTCVDSPTMRRRTVGRVGIRAVKKLRFALTEMGISKST